MGPPGDRASPPGLLRAALRRAAAGALALADLALPRRCVLCTGALSGSVHGLCAGCDRALPGRDTLRCPRCGIASDAPPTAAIGTPCAHCTVAPPPFDATFVLADYAPPLDHAIAALKYRRDIGLARPLGAAFARSLAARMPGGPAGTFPGALLTAVPLARRRLAERGFDQAMEIARGLAAAGDMPRPRPLLVKPRDSDAQATLAPAQRRHNLAGAFRALRPLDDATVLVVDDVMTTGATLSAAAFALRAAGATTIVNLVVARTPHLADDER